MVQINDDFYEDLDAPRTGEAARCLAARRDAAKPGSQTGPQASAPEGGPTSLTALYVDAQGRTVTRRCLTDADRIFTNLYGLERLGRWRARRRAATGTTPRRMLDAGPRRDHRRDEEVGPARARRRRLPDRAEMVVHAEGVDRSGRIIWWSTPTNPSPAPARTATSCATIRIQLVEGCLIAVFAMGAHACYIYIRGEFIANARRCSARDRRGL